MKHAENSPNLPPVCFSHPKRHAEIDPNGYKIMSVRLREAEYESFCQQVQELGLNNNLALRIIARRIAGYLEIDPATRQVLQEAVAKIGDVSQALTKIHEDFARYEKFDAGDFTEQRAAFAKEFLRLDTQLMHILSVSRRRIDGRRLLQDALNK